jgi:hypothetical protein
MSCRRAFDVDLADFLAHATRPEWAEFRAHYPRCATCAAEVRAWTELHVELSAAGGALHPAPEALARFAEAPAALPEPERRTIARHLEACLPCADEVRTLGRLDLAALVAAPRKAPGRAWFPGFVGRLVLHPAFAYALVLALVVPALVRRGGEVPAPQGKTAAAPAAREEDDAFRSAPSVDLAARAGRRERAASEPSPAAPEQEVQVPEVMGRLKKLAPAAGDDLTDAPVALLRRDAPVEVVARAREAVVLRLPATGARADGAGAEVRVVDEARRRELRERLPSALPGGTAEVRVPAGWLLPGRYRVELDAGGGAAVFPFTVRAE